LTSVVRGRALTSGLVSATSLSCAPYYVTSWKTLLIRSSFTDDSWINIVQKCKQKRLEDLTYHLNQKKTKGQCEILMRMLDSTGSLSKYSTAVYLNQTEYTWLHDMNWFQKRFHVACWDVQGHKPIMTEHCEWQAQTSLKLTQLESQHSESLLTVDWNELERIRDDPSIKDDFSHVEWNV
jgi:hypothetical protein